MRNSPTYFTVEVDSVFPAVSAALCAVEVGITEVVVVAFNTVPETDPTGNITDVVTVFSTSVMACAASLN